MQLFIVWTENDPRNWKLFMAAERIQHMFLTEKICVFRKIKTDGKTTTYISIEDRHPREISRKEYYSTHKDDRAKPLHIQLDIEHGDRALERQTLTWHIDDTIQAIFQLGDLCKESRSVLIIALLCLSAPLYDMLYPLVGGLVCIIPDSTTAPPVLRVLLSALAGDESWGGKHWRAQVPHIWSPRVPLGHFAPSTDWRDYAQLSINWKKRTLRLAAPCRNRLFVLESGVPDTIQKQLRKSAPLAIPVLLGKRPSTDAAYCITLEGSSFDTYDERILADLQALADSISALVCQFAAYQKMQPEDFFDRVCEVRTSYLPSGRVDHFVHVETKAETAVTATLLAVLHAFLGWLLECQKCTYDAANTFLGKVWATLLPESAPNNTISAKSSEHPRMEDAAVFIRFLADFLAINLSEIRALGENWKPHTVALLRTVGADPTVLLVFERENLFSAYQAWLSEQDGDSSFADAIRPALLPAKLQSALAQGGIPFKDGGRDTTWKYAFYPSSVSDSKVACLGLPVDSVLASWKQYDIEVGDALGHLLHPETSDPSPEPENVPEATENEVKAE